MLMMSRMRLSAARMLLMIMNSELPRAMRVPEPPRPRAPTILGEREGWKRKAITHNSEPADDEAAGAEGGAEAEFGDSRKTHPGTWPSHCSGRSGSIPFSKLGHGAKA
jgi:hypothetical protein